MKLSLYLNYPVRASLRGGQRTVLAIFCVAVGVMAVVSLQLVGFMLQQSLAGNARDLSGGDITINASALPLTTSDLTFLTQLKDAGTITDYTALMTANGTLSATASTAQTFPVVAIDPRHFPLVGQLSFVQPNNGSVADLLGRDQVLVSQQFVDTHQKHLGDTLSVYVKTSTGSGRILQVKIVGVLANTGLLAQYNSLLMMSMGDYLAGAAPTTATYSLVDITTLDQQHTDAAVKALNQHFPLTSVGVATDLLKAQQSSIDMINKFLEITGLLSLLIGGVGIVNTMQVQLSRRKTEIAMLKTAGFQRHDLYLLFGLEAGLLGLVGGILGAASAVGVSLIVRNLMQSLGFNLAFILSPTIIGGGIAIGCLTALIFGLLPIVQAASVRPLNVIREQNTRTAGSVLLTIGLLLLLSFLFSGLASVILQNFLLGAEATYITFAVLLVLSLLFAGLVLLVSKLPVPERLNLKQVVLILSGLALAFVIYQVLPTFSLCLLLATLLGLSIVFLPRGWKVSIKMALRNFGRRYIQTSTTMLALFIGIFGIALVVGVSQDLEKNISSFLTQNQPYNLVATTSGSDSATLQRGLSSLPGLTSQQINTYVQVLPVAINGQAPQQALPQSSDRQQAIGALSSLEGYNLAQSQPDLTIVRGRNLNASDLNTNHVLVSEMLTSTGWLHMHLQPGDSLTFTSADHKTSRTVTIVGIISLKSIASTLGRVIAPTGLVDALATTAQGTSKIFYLKIDPAQLNHAEDRLLRLVPAATVQDLTSTATGFIQFLNNFMEMLVAIASLSVIAAVIIIANAVALAMLERRRELGILKSVGYTSGTILSEVLLENGLIGAVGAFIATLLAAGGVVLLGKMLFNSQTSLESSIVLILIGGSVLLAMLTATLVSWRAVRVRPLTVLRYE